LLENAPDLNLDTHALASRITALSAVFDSQSKVFGVILGLKSVLAGGIKALSWRAGMPSRQPTN